VNIAVMSGKSLINLNAAETVFTKLKRVFDGTFLAGWHRVAVALAAVVIVVLLTTLFLKTRLGLAIRATGDNPEMVRYSSVNPVFTVTVGLCAANAVTALSGCLMAQSQKLADINMGQGMVTVALASLLIGGTLFRRGAIGLRAVGAIIGAIVFRAVYALALRLEMPAYMLKLVSAVIVIIAISAPYFRKKLPEFFKRTGRRKEGGDA
jgi:putative ABC transport system permease protein